MRAREIDHERAMCPSAHKPCNERFIGPWRITSFFLPPTFPTLFPVDVEKYRKAEGVLKHHVDRSMPDRRDLAGSITKTHKFEFVSLYSVFMTFLRQRMEIEFFMLLVQLPRWNTDIIRHYQVTPGIDTASQEPWCETIVRNDELEWMTR